MLKIKYKNDYKEKIYYILDSSFNPDTMIKIEETEEEKKSFQSKMDDIIKSKSAPGMRMKTSSEPSITHRGKIDEGAIENLLDSGLEGAKNRADVRKASLGASFIKKKNYKLRRKER